MSEISRSIGEGGLHLAAALDISRAQVDQIKCKYKMYDENWLFGMLLKWREKEGDKATLPALKKAVKESGARIEIKVFDIVEARRRNNVTVRHRLYYCFII